MNAEEAFNKVLKMDCKTILDIGSGNGEHAMLFRALGKDVTTIALHAGADIVGDFNEVKLPNKFDCIWASHVLEHQRNVGAFLDKCFSQLKDDGILAITVPPAKHNIVGGHLTLWNAGLLLYNLILAGFNCSTAAVKTYGYNISVVVRKEAAHWHEPLTMDYGDISTLAHLFPFPVEQAFDGQVKDVNWS